MPDSPSIHANNFDRVADIYDATRGFTPAVEAAVGDGLAAILRAHLAEPSVIEVGAGSGRIAVPLAARGIRVTGLDISTRMLQRLRSKRRDIDVVLAEASMPPFHSNSFDAAVFVHILHLVPDPQETLRATVRCLRPGALLLNCHHTYAPNASDQAARRLAEIVAEVTGGPSRPHRRRETADALFERIMRELGARIESHEVARWTETTTARSEIDFLKNRTHSGTWRIPEAAMPEVIARFTPVVEAIYGGLDAPSESPVSFAVLAAKLPE